MKKRVFYTELAYLIGVLVLSIGTAMMERADFGVSMVVAPAYILHVKLSQFLPFFSFGMAEYTLQAVLILATMIIVRKAKLSYLFSMVTAVLYGLALDAAISVIALIPLTGTMVNVLMFAVGMLLCSMGVSLLFHTYISPEAYELFVKEVSSKFRLDIHKFKTIYDCASCVVAVALSFLFFGLWHFEGVKWGTVICALLNGSIIHLYSKFFDRFWTFEDRFAFRKFF